MGEAYCGVSGVKCLEEGCPLVPSGLGCGYRTSDQGKARGMRGNRRKPILMKVPKNRKFNVDQGFVGKVVWMSDGGSTVGVVSTKRGALDEFYRTGKRDVYILDL